MNYLLDTNVVSEWAKPQPNPRVVAWVAAADEDRLFLSVLTFAEIRRGIELLPASRRRRRLTDWLARELSERFEGRIISIDRRIAESWAVIMARAQSTGARLPTMDTFLAATAETCGMTLVTRNLKDFRHTGIALFDPWERRTTKPGS